MFNLEQEFGHVKSIRETYIKYANNKADSTPSGSLPECAELR